MNIVVAMKQVPDLQQLRIRKRQPVWDDVPLTFGNIDKNALESGVQIKEAVQGKVIALCVGSNDLEDTVKEALAAGADEAFLVVCEGETESRLNARLIAVAISQIDNVDLVIMGEGSGDNYSSQVGSRVAQILGWPQACYANRIEVAADMIRISRCLDDGDEILDLPMPAVVTVASDINSPRIPSVTQILKAGRKPKNVVTAEQLGVELNDCSVETISNLAPEMQRSQMLVGNVSELLQALTNEGFIGG